MRPLSPTCQRALAEVQKYAPLAVFIEVRHGERTLNALVKRGLVRVVKRDGSRHVEVVS